MSAPANEQMAHECLHSAERATSQWKANIEGMAAQTYATLALVDAIKQERAPVEPSKRTYFVLAKSEIDALFAYKCDLQFESLDRAEEVFEQIGRPVDQSIFRLSVEVVQE